MDALAEHRDEHRLNEIGFGYFVHFAKELEPILQISIELRADVFAFDAHGLRGMSAKGFKGSQVRTAPYIKFVDDKECSVGNSLKLFSAELGNDRAPLADGSGADVERPRDVRGELVVFKNGLLQHSRHSTTVDFVMQPQLITSVLTSVYMDTTLAERLDKALKAKGASASGLARECTVSPAAVSKWLAGTTTRLTAENYVNAAKFLDVREEWLRTGKGPRELDAVDQEDRQADRVLEMLENLQGPLAALTMAIQELVKARSEEPQRKRAKR